MQAAYRFPYLNYGMSRPQKGPCGASKCLKLGAGAGPSGGAGKTGRPSSVSAVQTSVPAAVHFAIEKEVGCKNALLNELMRAPFCSLWLRFSCHSGSARKAVHLCSRSAIEFQCNM